jgi:hypothetical protein
MKPSPRVSGEPYVDLRQFIEALFREKERALQMVAQERDRDAAVLRDRDKEDRRADRAAAAEDRERWRSAEALRDQRLREHMQMQVAQLSAAIVNADRMSEERSRTLAAVIDGNQREYRLATKSSNLAVTKAEEAQQRVNVSQNEFRGQLADQAATLMPRRESEAGHDEHTRQLAELREQIAQLRTELAVGPPGLSELSRTASHHEGAAEAKGTTNAQILTMLGVAAAIALVVVELLTRHG